MTPPPSRGRGPVTENRTRDHRPAKKANLGASEFSLHGVFWMILVMIAVTLCTIFFVIPIMLQDYRDATTLQSRGVVTTAQAVRIIKYPGSARSGPTYKLNFVFRIGSLPGPIMDEADITAHEANIVRIPSSVPIVYDPLHPSLAALNLCGTVHRRHPLTETIGWMALVFVILATAWAGYIVLLVSTLRERRARNGR
ncbi:hypothetical protein C8J45_11314 [Sphingomonas sp. PP-CE-3G-477]|uniref:DUF3592 domain-containing protein n=1 Tax=Sphingomonas sp. PP-CE-3G-477 TaxID=2135660 RepID=UPI000D3438BF|nr:DUF3592 domain-containing protein [Sphingomonas sp. PP-CE-3G-477]PTQ60063.1 hypothetical protein C8J45_11314 [Sphingomonas sp. PP-CE-3G-477]